MRGTQLLNFSQIYTPTSPIRQKALRGQINWSSFNFLKDKDLEGKRTSYLVLRANIKNIQNCPLSWCSTGFWGPGQHTFSHSQLDKRCARGAFMKGKVSEESAAVFLGRYILGRAAHGNGLPPNYPSLHTFGKPLWTRVHATGLKTTKSPVNFQNTSRGQRCSPGK